MTRRLLFLTLSIVSITTSLTGMERLRRALCCCCIGGGATDVELPVAIPVIESRVIAIHTTLSKMARERPDILRSLYIHCKRPEYTFIPEAKDYLEQVAFLVDHAGTVTDHDRPIILDLLLPSERILDPEDWYFQQRVLDFVRHYGEYARSIQESTLRTPTAAVETPAGLLRVLYATYGLIENESAITGDERRRLSRSIPATAEDIGTFRIKPAELFGKSPSPVYARPI